MTATCPCCGQLLPPDNPFAGQPVKARIYDVVSRTPGLSRNEIAARVYADDADGGPDSTVTVSVHIHWMNVRLAKLGVKISAGKRRGYRLIPHGSYVDGRPITAGLVREIKDLYPALRSQRKVADQLGTSQGTVSRVMRGEIST